MGHCQVFKKVTRINDGSGRNPLNDAKGCGTWKLSRQPTSWITDVPLKLSSLINPTKHFIYCMSVLNQRIQDVLIIEIGIWNYDVN